MAHSGDMAGVLAADKLRAKDLTRVLVDHILFVEDLT